MTAPLNMPNPAKIPAPGATLSPQQLQQIDAASKNFESVFMNEMLKPMFDTVKTDKMFGGGQAEDVFRGLMVQQIGKKIAEHGGVGLARDVRDEMIRIQEGQRQ